MTRPVGPVLRARGLVKRFGAVQAVTGVDLDVHAGEVLGLVGPNGAGKSTTLRMCLGLLRPDAGTVCQHGRPLPTGAAGSGGTSAAFDTPSLVPYLTARETVALFAGYAGVRADPEELLAAVGIAPGAVDRRVSQFSHGMQQRVGLAVALLGGPDLLVLDEPHNGLDPMGIELVRDMVRDRARRGCAVVLSSHVIPEVEGLCDRVVVIGDGRVVLEGPVADLLSAERFVVDAGPPQAAARVLGRLGMVVEHREGGLLVVEGTEHDRAVVVRALVAADLDVREVRPERHDLNTVVLAALRAGAPAPAAHPVAEAVYA